MRKLLADYMRTEREIARLSSTEVCEQSGVSQSTLTRIENGHGNITLFNLQAVLGVYKLDKGLAEYLAKEIEVNNRMLRMRD